MLNRSRDSNRSDLVDRLDRELTRMAIAQYETPEFKLMFSTPLTLERASVHAILTVHYGKNRRDCWGYVQARSPSGGGEKRGHSSFREEKGTPASISSGSEMRASTNPTIFTIPASSPRKSSEISKPPLEPLREIEDLGQQGRMMVIKWVLRLTNNLTYT
jgi:hypothetical protein